MSQRTPHAIVNDNDAAMQVAMLVAVLIYITLRKQAWAMVGVLLLELNQDIWVFSGNVSHGLQNTSSATVMQRKKMIIERSNDLAKSVDGCFVMKSCLLNEVMQKHQKYFALTDDKGNLIPCYIAVKEFLIYVDVDSLLSHA
nr:hypothetical protein [Tanacetum cinerariifolium]